VTRLTRTIGPARAKELILLGQRFDAARAAELGVVNRLVAEGEAEAAAVEWAGILAAQPQLALEITRGLIDRSADSPLEVSLELEKLAQGMLAHSAESFRAS